jgi:hypothetical protein
MTFEATTNYVYDIKPRDVFKEMQTGRKPMNPEELEEAVAQLAFIGATTNG